MFFVASKIFWMFASPITLLLVGGVVGALLCFSRHPRLGRWLALTAIFVLFAAAVLPLGDLMMAPLENRFPPPPADLGGPAGVIVLGGAIDDLASRSRGQTVFDESGARITEAVRLARRYPEARIVYTGGSASITPSVSTEALEAKKLMMDLGVSPDRLTIEEKSRNSDENARFTAAILNPKPAQRWLLVTSAWHTPRSMGVFRKAGFAVVANPVGFYTLGEAGGPRLELDPARNLRVFELATHEWIGLAAYWASGRIDQFFPGPRDYAHLGEFQRQTWAAALPPIH